MKKVFAFFIFLSFSLVTLGQVPDMMSYQAVIRNNNGTLLVQSNVGVKITILKGSIVGTTVYAEVHNEQTNVHGVITLDLGDGTPVTGTFSSINWADGPYYLKTQFDPNGGTSYSIETTNQLMSVPYAFSADRAGFANNANNANHANNANFAEMTDEASFAEEAQLAYTVSNNSITNAKVHSNAQISISKIRGDAGIEYSFPTNYQGWDIGQYGMKTLTSITMTIPQSGFVQLTHTGYGVFFGQGRTMSVGVGSSSSSMLQDVDFGYLDGSNSLRYELPYTVTVVVPVSQGTYTFYALAEGNTVFNDAYVNIVPQSLIGVFYPKRY